MKAVAVIPARYASTRLPGKPLLDICGKPLIQHVWETVSRARGLDEVVGVSGGGFGEENRFRSVTRKGVFMTPSNTGINANDHISQLL